MVLQQQKREVFVEDSEAQRREWSQFGDKERQNDGLWFLPMQGF